LDTIASVVLVEKLGQSTYDGFAITVLVHTDMASPHLANAGTLEQKAKYVPDIIKGNLIVAQNWMPDQTWRALRPTLQKEC
jgi:acyl-CoA dehydrogenase